MMNQIIHPGDPFYISFDILKCHPNTSESFTFTLKSDDAAIGIIHDVIIKNGKCKEVCDLYKICNPCSFGIVPIISTKSNTKSFTMHITAKTQSLILNQFNIVVGIDECSIGSGYDHDAILLDCVDCAVNSFKMIRANAPCFVCTEQNGFSCNGQANITTDYNLCL
eukprot:104088_1